MPENLTEDQLKLMNYVGRHIVSLRGVYRNAGEADNAYYNKPFNFSGFVFNLREDWFLFTAGHVLKSIGDLRSNNTIVDGFRLDDAHSPNAPFKDLDTLTPFNFDKAPKHFVDQPELGDFAAIWLRQNYRELLSKNGIKPFSPEETSATPYDARFICHWLIGFPEELMSVDGEGDSALHKSQLVIIKVDPVAFEDLPGSIKSEVDDRGFHRDNLFARLPDANELTNGENPGLQSIVGMSGGPIIGWRKNDDGIVGYNLIAVQSRWWEKSRILMACTASRYISALDRTIQMATAQMAIAQTTASTLKTEDA